MGAGPCAPLCFVSAGEVSGDLYAAGLLAALRRRCPELRAVGLGGPLLQAEGLTLLADVRARSAVGLSENLPGLAYFHGLLQRLRAWLRQMRPQVVILVDFQGLNLQLAQAAHELGLPVVYFIAPQDWIWGWAGAARRLRQHVDLVLAVFAPEADFYRAHGVNVIHVGHPLLDLLPTGTQAAAREALGLPLGQEVVCWMPGSRQHEVRRLAKPLAAVQRVLGPESQGLVPVAADYLPPVPLRGQPLALSERYRAMLAADVVIGASGSMVLEAALLGRPVVALYRVSALTAAVARRLLRQPWITLPNLLLQAAHVPEFVQHLPPVEIAQTSRRVRENMAQWQELRLQLRAALQPAGAFERAADAIVNTGALHA